jgi:DNA-binding response OmpR family regulator
MIERADAHMRPAPTKSGATFDVSNVVLTESKPAGAANTRPRRALVCAGHSVALMLERQLAGAGYATVIASTDDAPRVIEQFAPSVVLIALHNGMDGARVALARRLRAEASTYALPIVFLYHKDERSQRSAALNIGVDDYFPLATPSSELCARLDALFWRAEAGRRAAPVVGEQRTEIDNFLMLLEAVRADSQESDAGGTLALIEALTGERTPGGAEAERTLAEAHGFLKLNLRRADAVAFYGPTMLLAYLPRMSGEAARENFARLREEFTRRRPSTSDIAVGLASFPADGNDVEMLIERAESAISAARAQKAAERVVAYQPAASSANDVARDATTPAVKETTRAAAPDAQEAERVRLNEAEQSRSNVAAREKFEPVSSSENLPPREAKSSPPSSTNQEQSGPDGDTRANPPSPFGEQKLRPAFSTAHVLRESRTPDGNDLSMPTLAQGATPSSAAGEALGRAAAEAGARELERRARGALMPRRLLLTVSDPARMAQLNLLIRSAGYDVRAAFDGQQALNLLRIERPDLLVLDYELHGMDGLEALRRLRQQTGGRLSLPVVLLVDEKHRSVHREALEAGARGVIKLPYDPVEFLDTVRRVGNAE